jgi:hypothetical protein
MPLSPHGSRQLHRLQKTYDPETAKRILYASKNMGKPGFTDIERGKRGHRANPRVRHRSKLRR